MRKQLKVFKLLRHPAFFLIPPLVFFGVFYFYPLVKIFGTSFFSGGAWESAPLKKIFATSFYLKTFWFTTWQAAVSTVLTFIFALPGAYVFSRYDFFGKTFFKSVFTIPFVLPTIVVAAGFQALLAPRGFLNVQAAELFGLSGPLIRMEGSIWIILGAHVFYNYAIVLRIVGGFRENIESGIAEAARTLGASPLKTFMNVTFPLLKPALITSGILVFIFCFSSFGVILILGGTRFATIEVEIYRQALHIFNLPAAAVLSMVQIVFTFAVMWICARAQRRSSIPLNPGMSECRRPKTPGEKIVVGLNIVLPSIFLGAPLFALVASSFSAEEGLSFAFYQALAENANDSVFFAPPLEAVFSSLKFAAATMVLAIFAGLPAALFLSRAKSFLASLFDPVFMLPLSTSAVTLGFGFIIALDAPPLNLRDSVMLIPAAHALVAFPFVVRTLLPAMRSIPKNLREAAAVLGASSFHVWRAVDLPIIARAALTAAIFAFTISMGEFGATAFVARPDAPTITVAIYRFLGQPGALNYGQAMAMSCLLMAATAAGFILLDRTHGDILKHGAN